MAKPVTPQDCPSIARAKLTTPEELHGVLNWALEGLRKLLRQKGFTNNKSANQ